ncbi:MAG: SDR family oxidoreductase [Candidatus Cloacimonetes bacterium]|nr:SDR family oxidoreductase [Candidatus Cloacimonadota bacterium]MCF7814139.1 SDR family oxidoreductase [Candidatus Cloacimonadota bacterium]MCF7868712.1 SDR family oxidoreductase [Candidatus Cloacimonadota bacterium]MCF7884138.1 SDR family oxidoreductase [Candidatus Cloacimonadota bacterium]
MYKEFKDKVALITGGTTGIGKSTAFAFAENGAKVIICGRRNDVGKKTENEAEKRGYTLEFVPCDVSDPKSVKSLIDQIIQKHGKLDFAFNNAGIDGEMGKILDCSLENWQKTIDINLNGVFYCLKYELEAMLKKGGGRIVNNASVSGHRGYPGAPAYIASKHAVRGLSKAAATEYAAENIRVNSISPGLIITPMFPEEQRKDEKFQKWVETIVPMKRMAKADEVAKCVLWLCSDQSSYVTGEDLVIDGGVIAK